MVIDQYTQVCNFIYLLGDTSVIVLPIRTQLGPAHVLHIVDLYPQMLGYHVHQVNLTPCQLATIGFGPRVYRTMNIFRSNAIQVG